jgi:hypothetical protein
VFAILEAGLPGLFWSSRAPKSVSKALFGYFLFDNDYLRLSVLVVVIATAWAYK